MALYLGLFLLAGATLGLELTLTRVFTLAQWYHFSFLAISMALLGTAAGGMAISLWPQLKRNPHSTTAHSAAVCSVTIIIGYIIANHIPFDAYRIAWEPVQFIYLAIYYVALAVPFICASIATGVLLATTPQRSHLVYAVNLVGAALGCAAAPAVLGSLGGAGSVLLWAGIAAVAALILNLQHWQWTWAGLCLVLTLVSLALVIVHPAWLDVRLSPYKSLPQIIQTEGARAVSQRWNAFSRVDVVASPALHAAPGLSLNCLAAEPAQQAVFVDGDNPSPLIVADDTTLAAWTSCLPLSLPFHLRPGAETLILEPGGNLDVRVAQSQGASRIVVAEPNILLINAAHGYPGTQVAVETGRIYLRRATEQFDLVVISQSGSRNVVTAGTYSLNEDYRYTLEAITDALGLLKDEGILVITRWLQSPPSEELRAWILASTALKQSGALEIERQMVAMRSWSTMQILVKNSAFSTDELLTVRQFCHERQFDLVYLPGLQPGEINLYNTYSEDPYVPAFRNVLHSGNLRTLYSESEYDLRPTSDDRPFFLHFFTARQVPEIIANMGRTWKPFGGSGYLLLVAQLVIAVVLGGILMILPITVKRISRGSQRWRTASYFSLLGIGFLAVEIPLLQRFILFLGNPTLSFSSVVASLLFFSGLGSLLAPRVKRVRSLLASATAILIVALLLDPLFDAFITAPLSTRLVMTVLVLAPPGLLMGMPFSQGLARLERESVDMIPWAWAVNGSASVVTSVAVAMAVLAYGFTAVLLVAVAVYAVAAFISWDKPKSQAGVKHTTPD